MRLFNFPERNLFGIRVEHIGLPADNFSIENFELVCPLPNSEQQILEVEEPHIQRERFEKLSDTAKEIIVLLITRPPEFIDAMMKIYVNWNYVKNPRGKRFFQEKRLVKYIRKYYKDIHPGRVMAEIRIFLKK